MVVEVGGVGGDVGGGLVSGGVADGWVWYGAVDRTGECRGWLHSKISGVRRINWRQVPQAAGAGATAPEREAKTRQASRHLDVAGFTRAFRPASNCSHAVAVDKGS